MKKNQKTKYPKDKSNENKGHRYYTRSQNKNLEDIDQDNELVNSIDNPKKYSPKKFKTVNYPKKNTHKKRKGGKKSIEKSKPKSRKKLTKSINDDKSSNNNIHTNLQLEEKEEFSNIKKEKDEQKKKKDDQQKEKDEEQNEKDEQQNEKVVQQNEKDEQQNEEDEQENVGSDIDKDNNDIVNENQNIQNNSRNNETGNNKNNNVKQEKETSDLDKNKLPIKSEKDLANNVQNNNNPIVDQQNIKVEQKNIKTENNIPKNIILNNNPLVDQQNIKVEHQSDDIAQSFQRDFDILMQDATDVQHSKNVEQQNIQNNNINIISDKMPESSKKIEKDFSQFLHVLEKEFKDDKKDKNEDKHIKIENKENNVYSDKDLKDVFPEDFEYQYEEGEIKSLQEIDDILNPDDRLKHIIKKEPYWSLEKDKLKQQIKDFYMSGDTYKLERPQIHFYIWRNYNSDDYDEEDIELFRKIDESNYVKKKRGGKFVPNDEYKYELMVIKNYKKFFMDLYKNVPDPNHQLDKFATKIKIGYEMEKFNPDDMILINKNLIIESQQISHRDLDAEDYIKKKKLEDSKKNKNKKEKNDSKTNNNNKNNNKKGQKNSKSKSRKKNTKKSKAKKVDQQKIKVTQKNKKVVQPIIEEEDGNENSDSYKEDKNEDEAEDKNEDEPEWQYVWQIFDKYMFSTQHRCNIYNTYRLYTSRTLDYIFYKTGWTFLYRIKKRWRKEFLHICLPCMAAVTGTHMKDHIKQYHNQNLPNLDTNMRPYAYVKLLDNNKYRKTDNSTYEDKFKTWHDNFSSKNSKFSNISSQSNNPGYISNEEEEKNSRVDQHIQKAVQQKDKVDQKNKKILHLLNKKSKLNKLNESDDNYDQAFYVPKKKTKFIRQTDLGGVLYDSLLIEDNIYFALLNEIYYDISNPGEIIKLYKSILEREKANNYSGYKYFIAKCELESVDFAIKKLCDLMKVIIPSVKKELDPIVEKLRDMVRNIIEYEKNEDENNKIIVDDDNNNKI